MNNTSSKNKLSKKLKYISIASAVSIYAAISTPGSEASANPFKNLWTRISTSFSGIFSKNSRTTTNFSNNSSTSKINRPSSDANISDSTSSSSSKGNSSFWDKFKSKFSSKSSNDESNVKPTPTPRTSNLKTTDLDDSTPTPPKDNLWNKFKGKFTGGNKTTSNKNKSGNTNHSYSIDSDDDTEFNPKFDDQNLKNLRFVVGSSGGGTLPKVNVSDKDSNDSNTVQQPTVKTNTQTSSGESSSLIYADLDFTKTAGSTTIHGSDDKTIYASLQHSQPRVPQTPAPQVPPKTYKSKLKDANNGTGKPPIPTPRSKNISGSSQSSLSSLVSGNQTPPPIPPRGSSLDENGASTSIKIQSSAGGPQSTVPKNSTISTSSSTITIGNKPTGGNKNPRMVTFNFD